MSILDMLARRERTLMDSRCTITRGTHPDVTTVATDAPCIVVPSERVSREVEAGGETVRLHLHEVTLLPNQDVEQGDVITVTTSRDGALVGRYLTVVDEVTDDWVTNRRVIAVEGRT